MEVEEGTGTRGVAYSYQLNKYKWFATYELRVHRSILDKPVMVLTAPFEVDERKWMVAIKHEKDGNVGAYLQNENNSRVTCHVFLCLVNHVDDSESARYGFAHTFAPTGEDGCSAGYGKLSNISVLNDATKGFLKGGFLDLVVQMRIRLQDNESCSISVDGKTATVKWKLRYLKQMSPFFIKTEPIKLGESEMRLAVTPDESGDELQGSPLWISNYSDHIISVESEVCCINHMDSAKNLSEKKSHKCNPRGNAMALRLPGNLAVGDESKGFVRNDWITFHATLTLLEEQKTQESQAKEAAIEEKVTKCLSCRRGDVPTCGVQHGNTIHLCYCLDCAKHQVKLIHGGKELGCPICDVKVENIGQFNLFEEE